MECRPEKIPCSIIDESVDISLVRSFFLNDAWLLLKDVVNSKHEANAWFCASCHSDLLDGAAVVCESCLKWYQFSCVGLTT